MSAGGNSGGPSGPLLLDDFEDGDSESEFAGCYWYAIDDQTGPLASMTFDAITGREPSLISAHVAAGPTSGYGSFLGLDLPNAFLDMSGYETLSFWARAEPPGELTVRLQNVQSLQFVLAAQVDEMWREFRLPIADFRTFEGVPIDPTAIAHLQFWLADTRPAYHLYVDDVWLLREP